MFIVGFSFFAQKLSSTVFDDNVPIGDTHELDFQNAIFDEAKIDKGNYLQVNTQFQNWGSRTIFDWQANDLNFEAGNITLAGMPIEYIRIKKKKNGELLWNTYKDIPFDPKQTRYNWSDYFIESLVDYDYAVLPVGANDIEGNYNIQSLETNYENIFILGAGEIQYKFKVNMTLDSIQNVKEEAYITTLGSKYPYTVRNGMIDYNKGHLKLLLITDETINNSNGIDRKAEKQLRTNVKKFLEDGNPKIFKESEQYYMLVNIDGSSVKLSPDNNVNRSLQSIEFDFTEIGDPYSMNTLYQDGLIEVKPT